MSARGKRRKTHGDHENHDRWLLTYADMITLLVAFFIMLYAMSVTNYAKFVTLALSVRNGFGNVAGDEPSILLGQNGDLSRARIVTPSTRQAPQSVVHTRATSGGLGGPQNGGQENAGSPASAMDSVARQVEMAITKSNLNEHVSVHDDERGLVITILADRYSFESGSDQLRPALKPVLDELAAQVERIPNPIRVEGHTDDLPIHNAQFSSNWQLSSMRAANVCGYLLSTRQFDPERFSSAGFADTQPAATNATDAGRARNRRVEIVILRNSTDAGASDARDGGAGQSSYAGDPMAPAEQDIFPPPP